MLLLTIGVILGSSVAFISLCLCKAASVADQYFTLEKHPFK